MAEMMIGDETDPPRSGVGGGGSGGDERVWLGTGYGGEGGTSPSAVKHKSFNPGYGEGVVVYLLAAYAIGRDTCLVMPLQHATLMTVVGVGATIYLLVTAVRLAREAVR